MPLQSKVDIKSKLVLLCCIDIAPHKQALDLVTLEGCKAELSKLAWLHTEVVYRSEDGHPSQY